VGEEECIQEGRWRSRPRWHAVRAGSWSFTDMPGVWRLAVHGRGAPGRRGLAKDRLPHGGSTCLFILPSAGSPPGRARSWKLSWSPPMLVPEMPGERRRGRLGGCQGAAAAPGRRRGRSRRGGSSRGKHQGPHPGCRAALRQSSAALGHHPGEEATPTPGGGSPWRAQATRQVAPPAGHVPGAPPRRADRGRRRR
jgi:hypothetical protein